MPERSTVNLLFVIYSDYILIIHFAFSKKENRLHPLVLAR